MPHNTVTTDMLDNQIEKAKTLPDFLRAYGGALGAPAFTEQLALHMAEKGVSKEALIRQSQIERVYGYQLFAGTRRPGRDKVIQLCIGLGLSVAQSQRLLKTANRPVLYARIRRDAILLFALRRGLTMFETQQLLLENGASPLGEDS